MTKMTMTVDIFDVIWAVTATGLLVMAGLDGADMWFYWFGILMIWWFREPLGDWLGERAANKMREQVHAE
jgi:hypothetical protein